MLLSENIEKDFRYESQELVNAKANSEVIFKNFSEEELLLQLSVNDKKNTFDLELQFNFSAVVKSQCSCKAYSECIHQKLGKLFLANFFSKEILPKYTVRKSTEPFSFPLNLAENDLKNLFHASVEASWFRNAKINSLNENQLSLKSEGYYSQIVDFQVVDNQVLTKCTCDEHYVGLCPHQYAAALAVIRSECNLWEVISSDGLKKLRSETLMQYGLPPDTDFDNFFVLSFEKLHIFYKPQLLGTGLQPLKSFRAHTHFDKFETFDTKVSSHWEKDFILCYFFCFEKNERINFALDAYKGKPARTGVPKSLKRAALSDLVHCTADETDHDLMSQLFKFANYLEIKQDRGDWFFKNLSNLWQVYTAIFPLLSSRKHIFLAESENYLSKAEAVQVSGDTVKLHFELSEDEHYLNLRKIMTINDEQVKEYQKIDPLLIRVGNTLHTFASQQDIQADYKMQGEEVLRVVMQDFDSFFDDYVMPLTKEFKINYELKSREVKKIGLIPDKKCIYLTENANTIQFRPTVLYNNGEEISALAENDICKKKDKTVLIYKIDAEFHREFGEFLRNVHPAFAEQNRRDFFILNFSDFDVSWFADFYRKMNQESVEIFGFNELKHFKYSPHKPVLRTYVSSNQDWFEVDLEIKFGSETLSLKELQKSVLNRNRYVRLNDGSMGVLPEEWLDKMANYYKHGEVSKGKLQISKFKFSILDELFENLDDKKLVKELAEKKQNLARFTDIENTRVPSEIRANLRDYQKAGYNWLNFLDTYQWGGILADDMGLGKTLQIITFLQKQANLKKSPNLIVLPTSLLFNWKNELEKFAPTLRIYFHYGNNRSEDAEIFKKFDLIITTYGTMLHDIEALQQVKFNYVILDESQNIKNPTSKRYKAACLLQAANRIAMTGTPIENNTFDLYAQMNFLNPGFLGNQETFKRNYANPIDKDRDKKTALELQKLISPFILRRMKEQVAKELPPKIEDYLYCEMEEEQMKVYEAIRQQYRDYLAKKFDTEGFGKSKLYVLEGLTKLRQVCDSPLLLSSETETYTSESVKIKELMSHIKEKTSHHKMLLFSQYVKMLHLIEDELKNQGVSYEYLDGQRTQAQREASVQHFQNDESCRVFLISLKAGGAGLILTKADYVYIIDPWWNPAVENQAIDRCYRIGQEKNIIAYRMICKDTVEEKIVKIQSRKKQLAADLITTDENVMKELSQEDILELFS